MNQRTSSALATAIFAATFQLACGGGDGDHRETGHAGQYQSPSQGVTRGPNDEVISLGSQNGPSGQEQEPASPGSSGSEGCDAPVTCLDACLCLGQARGLCEQYCAEDSDEGDVSDGGAQDPNDVCKALTDPCIRCVCESASVADCASECN